MKIYTGGGDKGKTSLFSGERVPQHHVRIEAYGDLDELNSLLGVVAADLPGGENQLRQDLDTIQATLFMAGAWLATTPDSSATGYLTPLTETVSKELEGRIDSLSEALPVLKEFILPGGQPVAAMAHVARTVCRRCERRSPCPSSTSAARTAARPSSFWCGAMCRCVRTAAASAS